MSHPNTNTTPAYGLPPHLVELVQERYPDWLDRQAKAYAEVQRRKAIANPENPAHFVAHLWVQWLKKNFLFDGSAGREVK